MAKAASTSLHHMQSLASRYVDIGGTGTKFRHRGSCNGNLLFSSEISAMQDIAQVEGFIDGGFIANLKAVLIEKAGELRKE